jgi:hypothetical protein
MTDPESNGSKPGTPEHEQTLRDRNRRQAAGIEFVLGGSKGIDPALRPSAARRAVVAMIEAWPEVRTIVDAAERLAEAEAAIVLVQDAGFDDAAIERPLRDERSAARTDYVKALNVLREKWVVMDDTGAGLLKALATLLRAAAGEKERKSAPLHTF